MSDILGIDYAACSLLGALCVCVRTHIYTHTTVYALLSNSYCTPVPPAEPCFIERLSKEQNGKISVFPVVIFYPQDLLPPRAAYTGCQFVQRSCRVLLILSGLMSIAKRVPGIISFLLSFLFPESGMESGSLGTDRLGF